MPSSTSLGDTNQPLLRPLATREDAWGEMGSMSNRGGGSVPRLKPLQSITAAGYKHCFAGSNHQRNSAMRSYLGACSAWPFKSPRLTSDGGQGRGRQLRKVQSLHTAQTVFKPFSLPQLPVITTAVNAQTTKRAASHSHCCECTNHRKEMKKTQSPAATSHLGARSAWPFKRPRLAGDGDQ